jgi:endogenous inhibitor of DNA gyrase (YacG/DUF329 family)
MTTKNLKVKCPHCGKQFNYYSSEFRPFCQERCKLIDMGQWLTESYRIPVKGSVDIPDEKIEQEDEGEDEDY